MHRIALYYPIQIGMWQQIIRGIFQYARPAKPWVFSIQVEHDPTHVLDWKPDAIIGQIETPKAAEAFSRVDVPIVDTSFSFLNLDIPRIRFDDTRIGHMAAEYLINRGIDQLAVVASDDIAFEAARAEGFVDRARQLERQPIDSPPVNRPVNRPDALGPTGSRFLTWLNRVAKPIGVFAAVDPVALRISEACRNLELRVPEDVAILGVNNDQLICNLAFPPLSSIAISGEQLGREAAEYVDRWLTGNRPADLPAVIPPAEVITRQSTDVYASEDPLLNRALRYIRDHAVERIGVQDVVRAVSVSRSSLERRFRGHLGRSPLNEIHRIRIQRAKQLLLESDALIPEIASACGFRDGKLFATTFRKMTDLSPTQFRQLHRRHA